MLYLEHRRTRRLVGQARPAEAAVEGLDCDPTPAAIAAPRTHVRHRWRTSAPFPPVRLVILFAEPGAVVDDLAATRGWPTDAPSVEVIQVASQRATRRLSLTATRTRGGVLCLLRRDNRFYVRPFVNGRAMGDTYGSDAPVETVDVTGAFRVEATECRSAGCYARIPSAGLAVLAPGRAERGQASRSTVVLVRVRPRVPTGGRRSHGFGLARHPLARPTIQQHWPPQVRRRPGRRPAGDPDRTRPTGTLIDLEREPRALAPGGIGAGPARAHAHDRALQHRPRVGRGD